MTYPNGSLPMRRPSRNFEQWVPQHGNAYMSSQQFLDGNSAQSLTYPNGNSASQYPVGQQQLVPGYPVAQVAPQSSQFPSPNTAYQTGQMFGQEYTIPLRPRPVTQETMANNNGQLSNGDPVTNSPPPPYTQYSQTPQGGVGALQPSVVPPIERIPTPVTASENFTPIQPAPAPAPAPDSGRCASNKARNARHLLLRRTRKALAAISVRYLIKN